MQNNMKSVIHRAHHPLRTVFSYWLTHRYGILFYTLTLTLVASPVLAALHVGQVVLVGFVLVNLVAALVGIRSRHLSRLSLVFMVVLLAIRIVAGSIDLQGVISASTIALVVLGFLAGIDTLRVAMNANRVNAELIYAALSVYILIGIIFAFLHSAVALEWPAAYTVLDGEKFSFHLGIYFSFVTQTTVGYGDVVPRSELARGISMVQSIAGQLYLAVLVARLVSLYVAEAEDDKRQASL